MEMSPGGTACFRSCLHLVLRCWLLSCPISSTLTWDLQVQVTDTANRGHRRSPAGPGDALFDSSLTTDLHGEWASWESERNPVSSLDSKAQMALTQTEGRGVSYQAHAHQQIWWRRYRPQARWGSKTPYRCRPPGPLSECPPCWVLLRPRICHHSLQHSIQLGELVAKEDVKCPEKFYSRITCQPWLLPDNSFLEDIYQCPI